MKYMKRNLTVLLTTGALIAGLSAGLTIARAQPTNPGTVPAAAGAATRAAIKRHPAMFKAIEALQSAKRDMENASHDFGGHKEAAMKACDKAIAELELALKSDKE